MKKALLLFVYCLLSALLQGQIQTGLVREINSGKKPVGGVQVTFEGAVPTTSDDNGIFRLTFSSKKAGDFVFLNEIRKAGYELVNGKDLEMLKLSNTNRLGEDIIVAKKGVIDAAKKEYYEVSDKALLASFNREKKVLQSKLQKAQLGQKEYEQQFTNLQVQFDRQQKNLEELAEKFARVNFDDVDSIHKVALELYKIGAIDEAIKKLEEIDLIRSADKIFAVEAKIAKEKKQVTQAIRFQIELYLLQFRHKDAETLFDNLIKLDTANLDIALQAVSLNREIGNIEKAKKMAVKIIGTQTNKTWILLNSYAELGMIHKTVGDLNESLAFFSKAWEGYNNLVRLDSTNFYKLNLAVISVYLGETYMSLGEHEKANLAFTLSNTLLQYFYYRFPDSEFLISKLASSYEFIAHYYLKVGNIDNSLKLFNSAMILNKRNFELNINSVEYKKNLALSYQNVGMVKMVIGDIGQAYFYFVEFYRISKEFSIHYPQNNEFKNIFSTSCAKLGQVYHLLGENRKAIQILDSSIRTTKLLLTESPMNVEYLDNLAKSYHIIGEIYRANANVNNAYSYFTKCKSIYRLLTGITPNNSDFKNALAVSCQSLGLTYLTQDSLEKANKEIEEYKEIEESLQNTYPYTPEYKNGVAIAHQLFGEINRKKNKYTLALWHYGKFREIEKELNEKYPYAIEYKENLSISYLKIGFLNMQLGDKEIASINFAVYIANTKEACLLQNQNFILKESFAIAVNDIGLSYYINSDTAKAYAHFLKSIEIFTELAILSPHNTKSKELLFNIHSRIVGIDIIQGKYNDAIMHLKKIDTLLTENLLVETQRLDYKKYQYQVQRKIASVYFLMEHKDSAGIFIESALNTGVSLFSKSKDCTLLESLEEDTQLVSFLNSTAKQYRKALQYTLIWIQIVTTSTKCKLESKDKKEETAKAYGSVAFYELFLQHFPQAEQYALAGLATDSTQTWIYTNLAPAYLYQGKWEQAKTIYIRLKDQPNGKEPFKVAFLQDLKDLEAAGITHPDVAKARALLEQ
jgi:tetratricopeptide (TPR) repeat protein